MGKYVHKCNAQSDSRFVLRMAHFAAANAAGQKIMKLEYP